MDLHSGEEKELMACSSSGDAAALDCLQAGRQDFPQDSSVHLMVKLIYLQGV